MRYWGEVPFRWRGLREVLTLGSAASLAPAFSAPIGAGVISNAGLQSFAQSWPLWWLGDSVGILLFVPIALGFIEFWRNPPRIGEFRWIESALMLVAVAVTTHFVWTSAFPFRSLILLPLLWAALRFELAGTAVALLLMSMMTLRYAATGMGWFGEGDYTPEAWQWLVQTFLAIVILSSQVVAALVRQNRTALMELRQARHSLEERVQERTAAWRDSEALLLHAQRAAMAGVWDLDLRTGQIRWSEPYYELYGLPKTVEPSYATWISSVYPGDRERIDKEFQEAVRDGNEYFLEFRIVRNGEVRWLCSRGQVVCDGEGAAIRANGFTFDITERRLAEEAVRESLRRERERADELQALLDTAPIGLAIALDATGTRIKGNRANEIIFGVPPGAELSKTATEPAPFRVFQNGRPLPVEDLPMQRAVRGEWVDNQIIDVHGADGRIITLFAKATPLLGDDGRPRGAVGAFLDVTELRQTEAELRETQARLQWILKATGIGLWMNEMPLDRLNWDAETRQLFFIPPEAEPTIDLFYSRLHPEDREPTRNAVETALRDRTACTIDHRAVNPETGEIRWIHSMGRATYDENGTPLRFDGINYDISDRRRLEDALRGADRRKDEFLATLAHELRNPLAPVRNALYVLQKASETGQSLPQTGALIAMMDRQIKQLTRLVDDLLEISRITRGKVELKRERVALADLLEQAVETSQPLIEAGQHRFALQLPAEALYLDADPVRVVQIVANLLNNAAKYTEPGGRIELLCERAQDSAVITVRDSGVGIPETMLPRVFDLFAQVNQTLGRAQGGLGIGLALVRRLVEMHGGRIEARSAGPGQGSEFAVHLPLAVSETILTAAKPAPRGTSVAPGRILIVDDNRDAADSLAMLLDSSGFTVHVEYGGAPALEALPRFKPEVVLLDLGMPNMSGYETAARIRADSDGTPIVLIALSGWGQEEDRRRTEDAGFNHHLTKPVDPDVLEQLLKALPGAGKALSSPSINPDRTTTGF